MFTGQASTDDHPDRSAHAELTPTPQNGPNSWPRIVVTPLDSAASQIRGDSRCTWVSMAPAVAIMPSPGTMTDPVPTTTSTPSVVSGLPARPTAVIRPSRMPMLAVRTPSATSRISTFVMTTSHDSRVPTARSPIPSRAVFAKPVSSVKPSSGSGRPTAPDAVTRTTRPVSPSATRSPTRWTPSACASPPPRPGSARAVTS